MDLPFAQGRFCSTAGIKNLKTTSDHRDASFGKAYGALIKELRLDARAIFIIDANDTVQYVEYVKEVTTQPNYEAAIAALKVSPPRSLRSRFIQQKERRFSSVPKRHA